MTSTLIDRIYEAAVVPDTWPAILDDIAALSGSAGTVLFTMDTKSVGRWTASAAIHPVVEGFISGGWVTRNPRNTPVAQQLGLAGFAGDRDLFSEEERQRDPMYAELLRPLGYGWFAGTHVMVPSGDVAVFDVERRTESGPMPRAEIGRLNALRPHLARSALVSTRLGLEKARVQVETLSIIDLPAAVIGSGGRVLAANALIEAASRQVTIRAFDRVMLVQPSAQALLTDALARFEAGRLDAIASIPLPGGEGTSPAVAHVVPVRRQAHDIFAQAQVLLIVTPLATREAPSAELLTGLFDLTPAEARVARALASGQTIEQVAASGAVSRETARSQLRSVFAKTGTGRQAELVRLLASHPIRPHASLT